MNDTIIKAEKTHETLLFWFARHDVRVALLTSLSLGMLGVLANASASITNWMWCQGLFFGLAALLLLLSLLLIYCSQYPKTKAYNSSLIFFGAIAASKANDYVVAFKAITEEQYLADLLSQIHTNSSILAVKFYNQKLSLIALGLAVIPWMVALFFSKGQ